MGWSCGREAGKTLERWMDACMENAGSSNVFHTAKGSFMYETSRTEHSDGAITGSVSRITGAAPGGAIYARRSGSFRIEGDGKVSKAPAFLKKAAQTPTFVERNGRPRTVTGCKTCNRYHHEGCPTNCQNLVPSEARA